MLDRIENMSSEVVNIVFYINSPSLIYYLRQVLKGRFSVDNSFIVDVDTMKQLNRAKMDSLLAPLMGGKWIINVNPNKIDKKDLFKALDFNTSNAVTVYWFDNYRQYKMVSESDVVRKQGAYCSNYYLGKVSNRDVKKLYENIAGGKGLKKPLFNYVAKTYNYDVEAVMRLFTLIKSGNEVKNRKDIIDLVGLGGNNVDSFLVGLLFSDWDSEKKLKRLVTKHLKVLQDLSYSYKFRTIRNFMLSTLDGFIEIKLLQIMGYYQKAHITIPDSFNSKRIERLRRFEWFVLEKVSLAKLLNLKAIIKRFNNFNSQIALIQAVITYINSAGSMRGDLTT